MSLPIPLQLTAAALAVVGAGAAGTALALTGIIANPQVAVAQLTEARAADAYDCVDGSPVAALPAGQRVVVTARSDDSAWFGLSNPGDPVETVWLPARLLTFDDAADPALPVGGACPTVAVIPDAVEPQPEQTTDPVGPAPVTPDTAAPQLSGASASPAAIACDTGYGKPTTSTISVTATDNRGIVSVTATWSGWESGQAAMTASGSTYSFVYDPADSGVPGTVTVQITARDAAGNVSAAASTAVSVDCLG